MSILKKIENKSVLVIGIGSIGLQHVQKLTHIGMQVSILEKDKSKLKKLQHNSQL